MLTTDLSRHVEEILSRMISDPLQTACMKYGYAERMNGLHLSSLHAGLRHETNGWQAQGGRREVNSFLDYGHLVLLRYSCIPSGYSIFFRKQNQGQKPLIRSRYIKILDGKMENGWFRKKIKDLFMRVIIHPRVYRWVFTASWTCFPR